MLSVGVRHKAGGERGENMQPKGMGTSPSPHCCPGWDRHSQTFPPAADGIPDGFLGLQHQTLRSILRSTQDLAAWSG